MTRAMLLCLLITPPTSVWAASITGTITDTSGAGIVSVEVDLLARAGGKGWSVQQTTLTNASGSYSFTVAAGDYVLRAVGGPPSHCYRASRYYDVVAPSGNGYVEADADVLTLSSGTSLTGISIVLETGGALAATVTNGGVGLGGVQVRVENSTDWRIHGDGFSSGSPMDRGSFTICGLPPGQYRVWMHDPVSLYEDLMLPGPYSVNATATTNLGSEAMTAVSSDPYEPNASPASAASLPASPQAWESSGAALTPRGSDVDFYCVDALAGERYVISTTTEVSFGGELRQNPWVDPVLGWFSTSPVLLLDSNDDDLSGTGGLNAKLSTGALSADGRYCIGVTSYGDPEFDGTGQLSAGRYVLRIAAEKVDFGDAPEPQFATLLASDGARHLVVPDYYLGSSVDGEVDGQPAVGADGDDNDGQDDEDGVSFTAPVLAGGQTTVDLMASAVGFVDAWIDWSQDGDWNDSGEQVLVSQAVVAGLNSPTIDVPASSAAGITYGRFRFSSTGGLSVTGLATDGEVEDHLVTTERESDLGVVLSASRDPAVVGLSLTYTVVVTNHGPSDASGVTLAANLPLGVILSSTNPPAPTCQEASQIVTCGLGSLPTAAAAVVTMNVLVVGQAELSSSATVSGNEADPVAANDSALEVSEVVVPLFADDFESGDVSSWSATVGAL